MKTVLEAINGGTQYLEKKGIEDARRNMQSLLAHQLGCTRMQLYAQFDRPLEEAELAPLREMLKKRGEGFPLQHLLGEVGFFGRAFRCDGRGLIPRPETEELAEIILEKIPKHGPLRILDMGCGSGVLGLTLAAERPDAEVVLADMSPDALALARENAGQLSIANVIFGESDLFSEISGSFDLIAANLPYVPLGDAATMAPELSHDPSLALFSGNDGLDLIRRFIPEAFNFLKPGGLLAMEIGYDQASQVASFLQSSQFVEIETRRDLSGVDRFPFATRPSST